MTPNSDPQEIDRLKRVIEEQKNETRKACCRAATLRSENERLRELVRELREMLEYVRTYGWSTVKNYADFLDRAALEEKP